MNNNEDKYYPDYESIEKLATWKDREHLEDHCTTKATAGEFFWCFDCKKVPGKMTVKSNLDLRYREGNYSIINSIIGGYELKDPMRIINSLFIPAGEQRKTKGGKKYELRHDFGERMTHMLTLTVGMFCVEPEEWTGPEFKEHIQRVRDAGQGELLDSFLNSATSDNGRKRLHVLISKVLDTLKIAKLSDAIEVIEAQKKFDLEKLRQHKANQRLMKKAREREIREQRERDRIRREREEQERQRWRAEQEFQRLATEQWELERRQERLTEQQRQAELARIVEAERREAERLEAEKEAREFAERQKRIRHQMEAEAKAKKQAEKAALVERWKTLLIVEALPDGPEGVLAQHLIEQVIKDWQPNRKDPLPKKVLQWARPNACVEMTAAEYQAVVAWEKTEEAKAIYPDELSFLLRFLKHKSTKNINHKNEQRN